MKKLLGIVVLGLLWCNTSSAEQKVSNIFDDGFNLYFKTEDYIILEHKGWYENIMPYSAHFNRMIPRTATNHCNQYNKRAFLFGYDDRAHLYKILDSWFPNFTLTIRTRFICAKDKSIATNMFLKIGKLKKHKGKKFVSNIYRVDEPGGFANQVYVEEEYLTLKTEPKEPKKKKPKQTPDDDKVVAASMGSGFFVTRAGHLVTNYHVIEGCNAVKANILGKEIQTDIIAVDKTNDLAIIKAEMNPSKVFPVSNKDVSLLQDVIVAGFPLGKSVSAIIKTHKGSVTALAGFGDNYSNFQTDATINQGNSGGPIMDLKGNVVGVAVQLIAAEHAQNVFFGVKSSTLKTFANANSINFLPPNNREMSNEDLGQLVTEATVFLECWMTVAKIKQIIAQEENRKAFYSEHK